jgi:hypothetical protein
MLLICNFLKLSTRVRPNGEADLDIHPARIANWRAITQFPHNPPLPSLVSAVIFSISYLIPLQVSPRSFLPHLTISPWVVMYGLSQLAQHLWTTCLLHIADEATEQSNLGKEVAVFDVEGLIGVRQVVVIEDVDGEDFVSNSAIQASLIGDRGKLTTPR